jgi:hypothetical protein
MSRNNDRDHPSDLTLLGRLGAFSQHAKYDVHETTRAGRAAFFATFETQVDPDHLLPERERARRAEAARRAYFASLALKSAQARRNRGPGVGESPDRGGRR